MSCHPCLGDELPILSAIPGPRGPQGPNPTTPAPGTPGKNAYAITTAAFTMPAAGDTVHVFVDHTGWCAVGQSLFVESAGYFLVDSIPSDVELVLRAQDVPSNKPAGNNVAAGKKVVAGGRPQIDGSALDDLDARVNVLEGVSPGNHTIYSPTQPSGPGLLTGDIWFDTAHNRKPYRWDGSGWVDMSDARVAGLVTDVSTLQTGVNILQTNAAALNQEYVLAVVGSGDAKRIAGFRVTVPGGGDLPTEFVVQADKFVILGPDGTGRNSPFYVEGGSTYIDQAVVRRVSAGAIQVGDIASVNIGYAGRLFHTSDTNEPKHYFRSIDIATSSGDGKAFGSSGSGFGFSHCTPAVGYGPLASGWTSSVPTASPDASGKVRVHISAALLNLGSYAGPISVYCQIDSGPEQMLASRYSDGGSTAQINCIRVLTGVSPNSLVKLFVAPCDGLGVVTPGITARYEIDATFYNW